MHLTGTRVESDGRHLVKRAVLGQLRVWQLVSPSNPSWLHTASKTIDVYIFMYTCVGVTDDLMTGQQSRAYS